MPSQCVKILSRELAQQTTNSLQASEKDSSFIIKLMKISVQKIPFMCFRNTMRCRRIKLHFYFPMLYVRKLLRIICRKQSAVKIPISARYMHITAAAVYKTFFPPLNAILSLWLPVGVLMCRLRRGSCEFVKQLNN